MTTKKAAELLLRQRMGLWDKDMSLQIDKLQINDNRA